MDAVPLAGDVCTGARLPALSLDPENMPLNKNHTLTSHILLLQPAAEVLSYINVREARFDILTHLWCGSLLIYFKKFQIQEPPTMNPVCKCQIAYALYCRAPVRGELPVQVNTSPSVNHLLQSRV